MNLDFWFAVLSFLLLLVGTLVTRRRFYSKLVCLLVSIAITFNIILLVSHFVSSYFTGNGIDDSIIYHIYYGVTGAGFKEYTGIISFAIVSLVLSLVAGFFSYKWMYGGHHFPKFKNHNMLAILLLFFSFTINPSILNLIVISSNSLLAQTNIDKITYPDNYVIPSLQNRNFKPKNFIYIYLESLEQTYFDEKIFPQLLPGLKSLKNDAIIFNDIQQTWGTGWTIAGMTASQCGIPLYTSPGPTGNSMIGMDNFLSGAICLGDILQSHGYNLNYMGGASLRFAGKGNFYKTHGFSSVRGKEELESQVDKNYRSPWGIFDDSLFDLALKKLHRLKKEKEPFGLFLLTLDTHHPDGHPSRSCQDKIYSDGTNKILNAVHCTDYIVTDFIKKVYSHNALKNTVVIIGSDHLAMRNTAYSKLKKEERKNLFMVLMPDSKTQKVISKKGSLLDLSPTVLSLLGVDVPALGFGRDLRGKESSLIEIDNKFDKTLQKNLSFYKSLWEYPSLNNGLKVDAKKGFLKLGKRNLKLPVLLQLKNNSIDQVIFDFYSPIKLITQMAKMPKGSELIWVDSCKKVSLMDTDNTDASDGFCLGIGKIGTNWYVKKVKDLYSVSPKVIKKLLHHQVDDSVFKLQRQRVELMSGLAIGKPNSVKTIKVSRDPQLVGDLFVVSVGGRTNGASGIMHQTTDEKFNKILLKRGISLIGIRSDNSTMKLAHVDSCYPKMRSEGSFVDIINRVDNDFEAYIILTDDSAKCSRSFSIKDVFKGLPFTKWDKIGFRQPYIGVIARDGTTYEKLGRNKERLELHITSIIAGDKEVKTHTKANVRRIAHAGGGYDGSDYTNSLNALNHNVDNYSYFEIDFSFTSDEELVCLHDWGVNFKRSFGLPPEGPITLNEFKVLVETNSKYQKCTLDSLMEWLKKNPQKHIVTDIKSRNIKALRIIAKRYPNLQSQIIPQIYFPNEYYDTRNLGYERIIWTLYRYKGSKSQVMNAAKYMDLHAVTMPKVRVKSGLAKNLSDIGISTYVHTINDEDSFDKFKELGIDEIYTDWLPEI